MQCIHLVAIGGVTAGALLCIVVPICICVCIACAKKSSSKRIRPPHITTVTGTPSYPVENTTQQQTQQKQCQYPQFQLQQCPPPSYREVFESQQGYPAQQQLHTGYGYSAQSQPQYTVPPPPPPGEGCPPPYNMVPPSAPYPATVPYPSTAPVLYPTAAEMAFPSS